jgi:hypothetical protein
MEGEEGSILLSVKEVLTDKKKSASSFLFSAGSRETFWEIAISRFPRKRAVFYDLRASSES